MRTRPALSCCLLEISLAFREVLQRPMNRPLGALLQNFTLLLTVTFLVPNKKSLPRSLIRTEGPSIEIAHPWRFPAGPFYKPDIFKLDDMMATPADWTRSPLEVGVLATGAVIPFSASIKYVFIVLSS